ncbi:MAR-binding filament-like protein 1 [Phaseolus vulgaris]|uniref:MAR-binding filament-like protein 1 n=1 Tax=Phaseolus vulgaris TaxID=3885 RepID=UPI0035C96E7E
MPFVEGAINRPPMFGGVNYAFWKIRMKIFMESIDMGIRDAVVSGPFIPMQVVKDEIVKKPWSDWSESERKKAQYDSLAKNVITSALNMDEFFRVSQCNSVKEMWEVLEVTHEGTDDVKRSRKHSLIQEYELFRMQPEESIADVQKRFTHIVNHVTSLGKVYNKEELNIKVLKCLDRSWQPKVTTISESRDLSKMSTVALFGTLIEHELELKRLKEQETIEKRAKGIALKTTMEHDTSEEEKNFEHDETLSLLTRKFNRFLKRKNRDKTQQMKRYSKSNDSNSSSYTCFGYGKLGHIKVDCPNNQNKEKTANKKSERGKGIRAYISWEENDVSSTSDSSTGSEKANLCFMVNDEGSVSDSVSDFSTDSESYDKLLIAFKETHDEANRLVVICNKLNKVNRVLEPNVKALEEELHRAKTDLVSLKLTCLHASIKTCENCKKLEKQVEYLLKTLSNFTKGRENLETLLGSQNSVFNKNGLGYNSGMKKNVKKLSSFFVPSKTGFSSLNNSNIMHTAS